MAIADHSVRGEKIGIGAFIRMERRAQSKIRWFVSSPTSQPWALTVSVGVGVGAMADLPSLDQEANDGRDGQHGPRTQGRTFERLSREGTQEKGNKVN